MPTLESAICAAINRYCAENGSNTPDFILAGYLMACLEAWNKAVNAREKWYDREPHLIGASRADATSPNSVSSDVEPPDVPGGKK